MSFFDDVAETMRVSFIGSVLGSVRDAGDWIADKTVGTAVEVFTGNVNALALERLKRQQDRDIARASGVGVGGKTVVTTPEEVKRKQAAARKQIDAFLISQDAHPSQSGFRLPFGINLDSAEKVRSAFLLVAALGIGSFFAVEALKIFLARRK